MSTNKIPVVFSGGSRFFLPIFFLCLLGLVSQNLPGNFRKSNTRNIEDGIEKENKKPDNIMVTFIELGSKRCVPCKKMEPIIEEIKKKYQGQVKVIFHDVWTDEGRPYIEKFKIRIIPTQVFLDKDGKEYFRHEGFFPREQLEKILKQKGVSW